MKYPSFIESLEFSSLNKEKTEEEQALYYVETVRKLYTLTTDHYEDFDHLITKYLEAGLALFDMEIGIVSEISGDEYMICNAISHGDSLKKGDTFALEDTYCREVYKSKEILGFPSVGLMKEMKDHPVYLNMKLESYISAPIDVDQNLFGTLNFTSTERRAHGFSEYEREFIGLMASSIGSFLSIDKREKKLKSTNDRLLKLVGIVSHDLRGPLEAIRDLSSYLNSGKCTEEDLKGVSSMIQKNSSRGLELVQSILETAAMGTGKIELQRNEVNVSKLLREVISQFQRKFMERNIKLGVELIDTSNVSIDPCRFEQVLVNLISNMTKYTDRNGKAKISLKETSDGKLQFDFLNSVNEKHTGKEDGIESIGFGLEIVREVLRLHGTELKVSTEEATHIVSFCI